MNTSLRNFPLPEDTTEIHLFPPETLPEAIVTSLLGIALKIPAYCFLWFIFLMSLSGFLVGCVNIIGHENAYHVP
ncbi:MAG: hypothetical protein D3922_00985 [Candidatus Electrothrix sp. AR1]|nr:hypothetical protein [Candidatus Electrothrix sp. AR1]